MGKARPLSTRTVGNDLRAAGFTRSRSSTTAIRGFHDHSQGYHVREISGGIRVGHYAQWDRAAREQEMLPKYAAALVAAGWDAQVEGDVVIVREATRG